MKYKLLMLLFVLPLSGFSQGYNNYWLLGYRSDFGLPFGGTDLLFNILEPFFNRVFGNCPNVTS